MSVIFNNVTIRRDLPRIVRNGLILHLDAADQLSYPGSGTNWFDLSDNGKNGVLTNNPTFDTSNGGSFVFNGSSNYSTLPANFFTHSMSNPFTISFWFKSTQTTGGTIFGQQLGTDPNVNSGGWVPVVYLRSDGKIRVEPFWTGNTSAAILSLNALNNGSWQNITTTFNLSINVLYVNGVYQSQQNVSSQTSYGSTYYYFLAGGYAASRSLGTNLFNGNLANFSFYNRALSADEIRQNFNTLRGRFGI